VRKDGFIGSLLAGDLAFGLTYCAFSISFISQISHSIVHTDFASFTWLRLIGIDETIYSIALFCLLAYYFHHDGIQYVLVSLQNLFDAPAGGEE
jgi:hypothetical protein